MEHKKGMYELQTIFRPDWGSYIVISFLVKIFPVLEIESAKFAYMLCLSKSELNKQSFPLFNLARATSKSDEFFSSNDCFLDISYQYRPHRGNRNICGGNTAFFKNILSSKLLVTFLFRDFRYWCTSWTIQFKILISASGLLNSARIFFWFLGWSILTIFFVLLTTKPEVLSQSFNIRP